MRAERFSRLHSDSIKKIHLPSYIVLAVFKQKGYVNVEKEQGSLLTMKKPTVKPSCLFPC